MKVLDLNLLLYSLNRDSPYHKRARKWLEATFAEEETVGLPWIVLLGFLRLSTRPGVFATPLQVKDAVEVIDGWTTRPNVVAVDAGVRHWPILRDLLQQAGTAGNLTTDAHLAAIAIEYGATLYSSDNDFARFKPGLKFCNPLL